MRKHLVRQLAAAMLIGLLGLCLNGCATPGPVYDDSQIARISKESTKEADLLQWFGPACSRTMAPDGSKTLTWKFGPSRVGGPPSGRLEVRLNADGKVTTYSASGLPK